MSRRNRKSKRVHIMRQRVLTKPGEVEKPSVFIEGRPDADKFIVIIETPPTAARFIQVTQLMNEQELEEAKRERPDLVFRIPTHMAIEHALQEEPVGESLTGMTIPAEDQDRWLKDLGLKD